MSKPWSADFNPRREGEHVADWLEREVALLESLCRDGKPTRAITISSGEARALLSLITPLAAAPLPEDKA